ncbi:hypothetical protein HQ560_03890, partial [bacterium]|nr:hypothetical protein [bacterium]
MRHLLPLLLSALVSLSASAGTFRVPLLRKPPVLDGKIDPAEWVRSAGFDGLAYNNVLDRRRARVRVAATPTHLYLAIQSQLPAEGELLAKVDKDTVKVVFDDSIEVWIDPTPGSEHGQAFQMLANSLGRTGYKHHGRGRVQENPTWKGNWQVANGMHDGWWFCEIAIPIASIARDRIASQGSWGINICRNWKQPWAFSSTGGGPYSPTDTFTFSPDALAIAHVVRDDVVAGKIDTTLALTNPSDKPVTVKASLEIARDAMPTLAVNETLTVVPGQTLPLRLKADDQNTKKFALAIRVASPDGKTVHYARQYKWALGKAWQWTTKKKEVLPIDFQFTYSPYRKHIQVLVDTGNLPQGAQVDRLAVAVRKKGAPKALKTMTFIDGRLPAGQNEPVLMTHPLKASALGVKRLELRSVMRLAMFQRGVERADRPKQELLGFPVLLESGKVVPLRDVAGFTKPVPWDIRPRGHRWRLDFHVPAIDEGVYEIAVRAEGKGVPTGERVKEFERTRFEWERKGLGTSTKVYAPFTPIAVKGDRVDTVLREHTMNGFGLWDQVIARGRPLLAKPIRFVAQVGGKDVPLTAWTPHFTQKDPHRAVAHSAFAGGPVHGHVVSAWDVDGMMRVDLSLASAQTATVESVRLEIPLADDLAPLMHAMGDGIRNTVYAPVPKGDGVVWDSSKVQVNDFPANFCSYIYLGNGVRGLAWFAENDRGWSWDSAKPNLDLVRRDGQLILRVHLINKPVNLWRPRIITFGLQAAPVKPRIANWRYIWKRENYTLLGTDINWLARGNCGSVYPAGKDMFLWDMIKRGNREKLSREAVQKTIDHGKKYFEPYGPQVVETFVRHVPHNLLSRHGTKMVFYNNRASCQLFPEFQTFQ